MAFVQSLSVVACLVFVLSITPVQAENKPFGKASYLTQKGMDRLMRAWEPFAIEHLYAIPIPNLSGDKSGFDYEVTDIKVVSASIGQARLKPVIGQGMQVDLGQLDIRVTGSWSYRLKTIHFPFGSGSLEASVGGNSSISAFASLVVIDETVRSTNGLASSNIDKFDVTIHGSVFSWLYNAIVDGFEGDIAREISNQVNSRLTKFLNNDLNNVVLTSQLTNLGLPAPYNHLVVDLSPQRIVYADSFLYAEERGQMYLIGDPSCPYTPIPLDPLHPSSDKMMALVLSPYLINSALWSVFQHQLSYLEITPPDVPSSIPNPLKTDYIKPMAPGVTAAFPSKDIHVFVNATTAPLVQTDSSILSMTNPALLVSAQTEFVFRVVNTSSQIVDAFAVQCPLNLTVYVTMDRNVLHAEIDAVQCALSFSWSNYGSVDTVPLKTVVDSLLATVLLPLTNKIISGGYEFPTFEGLTYVNTTVASLNHTLLFQGDFEYEIPSHVQAEPVLEQMVERPRGKQKGKKLDQ